MREHIARGQPKHPIQTVTVPRHIGYVNNKNHGVVKTKKAAFICRGHQGKENAYVNALRKAGYKRSVENMMRHVKFVLADMDNGLRRDKLDTFHRYRLPVFLYPHAARPQIVWDGIWEPWPHIKCNFVPAPGHKEVMERYGYEYPVEVTGWTYCDLKPFKPVKEIKTILFGPIHPSARGWFADEDLQANKDTFKVLLKFCRENKIRLTVRYIQELKRNGLERVSGVTYIQGRPDLTIREIDKADVIVGHQTFAYLGIARGKPTLMMREDIPPHTVYHGQTEYVRSWEKYADIMQYPLDILAGDPAGDIEKACKGTKEVKAWADRFINHPFDAKHFVERLESYL